MKLKINDQIKGSSTLARTIAAAVFSLAVVSACSSGSSDNDSDSAVGSTPDTLSPVDNNGLPITTAEDADNGDLIPLLMPTQTELDLSYAETGVELIRQANDALILPNDIDVVFADCGVANAFYVPPGAFLSDIITGEDLPESAGGAVVLCHELSQLFFDFYADKDQAVGASNFVIMHELGHALVNQLRLPVLGIEESYVDGMAAVFLGESGKSEGSVLAGWFFGSQTDTPFFDSHRAGPQRLGDLACWGVGGEPGLAEDELIGSIATQLFVGGRNCAGEYIQQRDALNIVLGPHLRSDVMDIFTAVP